MIKISQLPDVGPYAGNELAAIVQDGETRHGEPLFIDSEGKVPYVDSAVGGNEARIESLETRADETDTEQALQDTEILKRTTWGGEWNINNTPYQALTIVSENGWLAIANKETSEHAAPQVIGDVENVYNGTLVDNQALAKQVIFGTRYTAQSDAYLSAYRIYTVAGNHYNIYSIVDPTGSKITTQQLSFLASTSGWQEFSINPVIVETGSIFDLVATVSEPDPTPTTFVGNWNYITPNNPSIPLSGEVSHSSKDSDSFRIHKTDNNGTDRSAELSSLTVGDVIEADAISWSIQFVSDQGAYIDFTVAPATLGIAGLQEFTFQTVTATPITYGEEVGYWSGNPTAKGILLVDEDYSQAVPTDDAYGVDLYVQGLSLSDDFDIMSSGSVAGGGSSVNYTSVTHRVRWETLGPYPAYQIADTDNVGSPIYYDAETQSSPFIEVDLALGEFTFLKDATTVQFDIACQIIRETGAGTDTWGLYFETYDSGAGQWVPVPDSTRYFTFNAQADGEIRHISYPVATNAISAGSVFRLMQITSDVSDNIGLVSSNPFAGAPVSAGIVVSTRCSGYV